VTKTALIVAYYFPPIAASGSMRPLGFCRYLERYGWRPRVLTAEPTSVYPIVGMDESLCDGLPSNVRIDRVPDQNPVESLLCVRNKLRELIGNIRLVDETGVGIGKGQGAEKRSGFFAARYGASKKTMLEWLFSFPDPQCFWLRPAVQRLAQISPKDYPDVVLATGGPWTSLLVGKALAKKFGVPFIADFRDPWTSNPNRKPLSALLFRKHKELEKSVCAAASKVIANTQELGDQFRHDNPELEEKFITITNGFDSPRCESRWSLTANPFHESPNPPSRLALELCHFGTIYGNRSPLALFMAIKSLFEESRITKDQLQIRLVGDWLVQDDRCETLAQKLERTGFLRREPALSHANCLRQMALAQILLILQPEYPLQVPAKIYEYIATGRPILVIGGEGATAALVGRHQLGICCLNDLSAIRQMLLLLLNGNLQIPCPTQEQREKFHYRNLTRKLADILDVVSMRNRQELPLG
jgi:hypothetical protein